MTCFQGRNFSFPLGKRTYVMGILNVTPDSFSDGGLWFDPRRAVSHALEMEQQGADLIDLGGQSTRPGHVPVSAEEELSRLIPVLDGLHGKVKLPVSVDTYDPLVAREALDRGAAIINDVSGVFFREMAAVVKAYGAGWIVMHTGGADASTQGAYPRGVIAHVRAFFEEMNRQAVQDGISPDALCFDPGIGFGKTYAQNLELLRETGQCRRQGQALLVGASRKRVIGEAGGEPHAGARMPGTLAAHTAAVAGGADFLRVHDVAACVQAARVADAIYREKGEG